MTSRSLTPYLLDNGLLDYTQNVTLSASNPKYQGWARRTAITALHFFVAILDPNFTKENEYLKSVKKELKILHELITSTSSPSGSMPKGISLKDTFQGISTPLLPIRHSKNYELSATYRVLTLPDTLHSIFSHIAILDSGFYSKETRNTLLNASLTSRLFQSIAQALLWQYPRDLSTLEQQVAFAFGLSISQASTSRTGKAEDGLGVRVKRLRVRLPRATCNMSLLVYIASFLIRLQDLTVHWGDSRDRDPVTLESVTSINQILSALPYLKKLHLAKYSWTTRSIPLSALPHGAEHPFAQLEFLHVDGFQWYSPAYSEGLGSNLTSLAIGRRTIHSDADILRIIQRLTSLTRLQIFTRIDVPLLEKIIQLVPQLEAFEGSFLIGHDTEDHYSVGFIKAIVVLKSLKKLTLGLSLSTVALHTLIETQLPLEEVDFALLDEPKCIQTFLAFLKAKKETLRIAMVEPTWELIPTDEIVEALAEIPNLERIVIDFADNCQASLAPEAVDRLLNKHPHIQLTDSLECLASGNALYEAQFRGRLEKAAQILKEGEEENILGNYGPGICL